MGLSTNFALDAIITIDKTIMRGAADTMMVDIIHPYFSGEVGNSTRKDQAPICVAEIMDTGIASIKLERYEESEVYE